METSESNAAWADAMAKVLRSKKTADKKGIVLSKAKKLDDVKKKPKPDTKLDFEIVGSDDEKPSCDEDSLIDEKDEKPSKISLRDSHMKGRVKPSILNKDHERSLTKIATKGVVQLFNLVREQQKTVDKKLKSAGKSTVKREKLLESIDKKKFLHTFGKPKSGKTEDESNIWNALHNDFMMGSTKLKDWDKQDDF